jgi:hypothetical protein
VNQRQKRILDEVLSDPSKAWALKDFLRPGVVEGVGRTTVYRDLDELAQLGILSAEGATRDRIYRLDQTSDQYLEWDLSRNPAERQPVDYNPKLLEAYEPNVSHYLSPDVREELHALAVADRDNVDGAAYRRVLNNLVIDLAHASSNLEEVRISWLDTKTLLELDERPNGLSERELTIVLNHKAAIAHLVEHELEISPKDLKDLHSLLMKALLADPMKAGALRTDIAFFDTSTYRPISVPNVLKEQFEVFCEKASAIEDPFEKSLFAMLFIPYLQAFHDGNKRTSRLAMNIPLKNAKLAPFSFSQLRKRDYMFGLLAFYERGQPRFLARYFVDAYKVGAKRYNELMKHVSAGGILATLGPSVP